MNRIIRFSYSLVFFLWLCIASISAVSAQPFKRPELPESVVHQIDSLAMKHVEAFHYPGLAIGIAYKGDRLWTKGYGYSDLEHQRPIDPNEDLFRIGSISKSVTACALARFVQKKKLDLDRPIGLYQPECPSDKANLTLRQLGGHQSGIRHYRGLEFFNQTHYTNCVDPLAVFIHDSLLFVPGTQYAYSTYGWTVISAVMESALRIPFSEMINREVTLPLHLVDLKTDQIDSLQYRRVTFYDFKDSMLIQSPMVDNSNKWGGGGFLCTADDLARFGFSLVKPGYLKSSSLKTFTTRQLTIDGHETNYGIGFGTGVDKKGRAWFGHAGGSVGGTSMMLIYPEYDLVVITLINLSSADMNDLAEKIADVFLASGLAH